MDIPLTAHRIVYLNQERGSVVGKTDLEENLLSIQEATQNYPEWFNWQKPDNYFEAFLSNPERMSNSLRHH